MLPSGFIVWNREPQVPPLRYARVGMTNSYLCAGCERPRKIAIPKKSQAPRMTILWRIGDSKTSVFSDFEVLPK